MTAAGDLSLAPPALGLELATVVVAGFLLVGDLEPVEVTLELFVAGNSGLFFLKSKLFLGAPKVAVLVVSCYKSTSCFYSFLV